MRRGSRSALQGLTGVLALIALTWPLLVFDRPLYVLVSVFSAGELRGPKVAAGADEEAQLA